VIDHLKRTLPGDCVVVYYFFDFFRKDSLSAVTFLRSLLHQLIHSEILSPDIQRILEAIFDPNGVREPDIDELEKIIIKVCGKLDKIFFIIDGIDEAEEHHRRIALRFLKNIEQSRSGIQIFVASQSEVDIAAVFGNIHAVHLKSHDLETDIKKFIDFQLETEYSGVLSVYEPDLISAVKNALILKAEGMYVQTFHLPGLHAQYSLICNQGSFGLIYKSRRLLLLAGKTAHPTE